MIIVELSITEQLGQLTNIEPFVYAARPGTFSSTATFPVIFGWTVATETTSVSIIDFLRSPATRYVEKSSYSDVVDDEASWYFDSGAQILYFHTEHTIDWRSTFLQGNSFGYCSERMVNIGAFPHLPLVKSTPSLSQSQDLIDYDIPSLISGAIEFDNSKALLDFIIDLNIYGNRINISFLDDDPLIDQYDLSDPDPIASLYVKDYAFDVGLLYIRVKDLREEGNVQVPVDLFSDDDYSDIEDDLINKPIPLAYGELREIPLVCTNGKTTSGNVNYRAGILMADFGTAYVKDGDVWTSVTPVSTDTATGEIVLAEADARNGTDARDAKLVNCEGIANDRASDVIVDLNERVLGLGFNSSNYDLTEWAVESLSLQPIAMYIDDQKKLFEVISDIQNGVNVGFRYEITAAGLRTIRIDSESRTPVLHAPNTEMLDRDSLPVETDTDTLAAIVNIDYSKSYITDKYLRYTDDSQAASVLAAHKQKPTTTIQTLLTTSALAAIRATYHLDRNSIVRGIFSTVLMGSRYLSLRVLDLITTEITPSDFVDIDNSYIEGREYFGIKTIKLISVDPDLKARTQQVSGVIIGTAEFPEQIIVESGGTTTELIHDDGEFISAY